jgi:plastocyanin
MAITTPSIPTGTICKFQQTTAPTLWTKLTSYNDYALRVTSGTVSTGGTRAFSAVFANQVSTAGGTLGTVTASVDPAVGGTVAHQHIGVQVNLGAYVYDPAALTVPSPSVAFGTAGALPGPTTAAGGGVAHNHSITVPATYNSPTPLSATNADFSIKYVDMILAQRN